MALLRTFALVGLDAVLYTAEVHPGQKRLRFQCERDLGRPLEWPLDLSQDFRCVQRAPASLRTEGRTNRDRTPRYRFQI